MLDELMAGLDASIFDIDSSLPSQPSPARPLSQGIKREPNSSNGPEVKPPLSPTKRQFSQTRAVSSPSTFPEVKVEIEDYAPTPRSVPRQSPVMKMESQVSVQSPRPQVKQEDIDVKREIEEDIDTEPRVIRDAPDAFADEFDDQMFTLDFDTAELDALEAEYAQITPLTVRPLSGNVLMTGPLSSDTSCCAPATSRLYADALGAMQSGSYF